MRTARHPRHSRGAERRALARVERTPAALRRVGHRCGGTAGETPTRGSRDGLDEDLHRLLRLPQLHPFDGPLRLALPATAVLTAQGTQATAAKHHSKLKGAAVGAMVQHRKNHKQS